MHMYIFTENVRWNFEMQQADDAARVCNKISVEKYKIPVKSNGQKQEKIRFASHILSDVESCGNSDG